MKKKGADAMIVLRAYNRDNQLSPWELQYEANLDFETIKIIDKQATLSARRINLDDLFRTRRDTDVSLDATESIDGEPITGISPQSMFLHGKALKQEALFRNDGFEWVFLNPPDDVKNNTVFDLKFDGVTFEDGDKPAIQEPQSTYAEGSNFGRIELGGIYVLNVPKRTPYKALLNYRIKGVLTSSNSVPAVFSTAIELDGSLFGRTEVTVTNNTLAFDEEGAVSVDVFTDSNLRVFNLVLDGISRLESGHKVDVEFIDFELNVDRASDNGFADVYNPFDVINHTLEVINNKTNLLDSDFWSTIGNEMYITNGYKIRNYPNRSVIVNFEQLFDKWAVPMFGLGYQIYQDGSDFKIKMERYDFFYQDVELDYIDSVVDESFEISTDSSIIFNEAVVGYKDFPKSTDENISNNIDEYNTSQSILFPIKTIKKKAKYESELIASGFKISNHIVEQFKEAPVETVTDDDKNFVIKGVSRDNYFVDAQESNLTWVAPDTILVKGYYFDFRKGDVINFDYEAGSSPNEGPSYVINELESVTEGLKITTTGVVVNEVYDGAYTVTLPETRLRAERNDNMEVVNNVISPETSYNLGLTPKNMLFNQSLMINSGLHPKPKESKVYTQDFKLNGEMESQFKVGEGSYVLDPNRQLIKQNETLEINQINSNNKLFTGRLIKFTSNIGYDRLLIIRDACLNQSQFNNNYGWIRVLEKTEDKEYFGWIMSLKYNPLSQMVDFELRERFIPEGGSFNYGLDNPLN